MFRLDTDQNIDEENVESAVDEDAVNVHDEEDSS